MFMILTPSWTVQGFPTKEKRSSKGTVRLSPHLERRLRGGRSESEILSLVVKSIGTETLQFPPQKGHCSEPGGMFGLTQMS